MWSPAQYERFKQERRQPFEDLSALIRPRASMRVLDLGCGTGELTRELHDRLRASSTLGIDSSPAMLTKAARFASAELRFEQREIPTFQAPHAFDLVFSNAALHWLGEHERLFRQLASLLAPAGQLAIQMPANDPHASHRIAAETARDFGIRPRATTMLAPAQYGSLLHHLGFREQHVRLQVYGHQLDSAEDVIEWNRGALLTHYQQQLEPHTFEHFIAEYRHRLLAFLGDARPYFYTYDRVLIHATLP